MKLNKTIHNYYQSKIDDIDTRVPPSDMIQSVAGLAAISHVLKWENIFGLFVTVGYLLQLLLPMNWFSLGRIIFIFRFGF